MTRKHCLLALTFAALALGALACTSSTTSPDGVLAINLRTGETRTFEDDESVPEGWATCAADMTCPDALACSELDETACIVRTDCDPTYAEGPPDSPDPFVGCGSLESECTELECGPAPGAPNFMCDDGSWGGPGPCARGADGVCGYAWRECPRTECEVEECGPAPGAPSYMCEDGSIGGNTGRCIPSEETGECGWEFRDCPPPPTCADTDCGPAPGAHPRCSDGSGSDTVCASVGGVCGWQFECGGCSPADCGPAPGADFLCPGGDSAATICEPSAAGSCGWQFYCPGE